jgi:ABC-type Fe3+-hydroxamate transport system substrate-binding protein
LPEANKLTDLPLNLSENKGFRQNASKSADQNQLNNHHPNLSENKGFRQNAIKSAYFIWKNPWMVAGNDTFINEMMKACGLTNVFAGMERYPTVTIQQLQETGCQLILLSSEPYPFKQKHIAELQLILPEAKILLVDGEMFSWYGSRLLHAPAYFKNTIISTI